MRFLLLPGAFVLACLSVSPLVRANPVFNLTYISGTSAPAQAAFSQAAAQWAASFTDNVTINLTVGTGGLGSGILANTETSDTTYTYSTYRAALAADRTSANDALAVSHLPNTSSVPIYINYTLDNPHGAGSATPYVDLSGANNSTIRMSNANARALGLAPVLQSVPGCTANCDGFIEFSDAFTYDFDRSNGISSGTFDFVGLALHEIGHALGFISGVDILDINAGPNFFNADSFTYVTPLDTFRCSTASASEGATLDFTVETGTKSFSLDNCVTTKAPFATGRIHGDGRQASHWRDNLGLGVMDPTANPGELLTVTDLDLMAFDVIGWNLVPEPGVLVIGVSWVLGLMMSRRRRVGSCPAWRSMSRTVGAQDGLQVEQRFI